MGKVKSKVVKKAQAKPTDSSIESRKVIKREIAVTGDQKHPGELGELPNMHPRAPVTPPPRDPESTASFTPDPAHDPRSPRKRIRFSTRSMASTQAPLQLVPTRSSEYDVLGRSSMYWPNIIDRPDPKKEGITQPDSPTLAPVGGGSTGEPYDSLCSRRPSQVELPTLTGRHVRSKSENWVLYELDGEQEGASGSN